jgi:hypothetical protein
MSWRQKIGMPGALTALSSLSAGNINSTGASAFDYTQFPNLLARYDMSAAANLKDAGGSAPDTSEAVQTITDLTGNGHDLVQTSATLQGIWDGTGLDCDATDDFYQVAFGSTFTQPNTIWMVADFSNDGSTGYAYDGDDTFARHALLWNSSGTEWRMFAGTNLSTGLTDTLAITTAIYDSVADTSLFYVNGGAADASGNAGTQTLEGFTLNARFSGASSTQPSGCRYREVLITTDEMTVANINILGTHLADKYGLSWTTVA